MPIINSTKRKIKRRKTRYLQGLLGTPREAVYSVLVLLLSVGAEVQILLWTPANNAASLCFQRLAAFLIMGRLDPVECAERTKYKPPAMRVRGNCYTKKSPFRYNEVVQAT